MDQLIIFSEAAQSIGNQKRGIALLDNAVAAQGTSKNIQKMVDRLLS